jgi:hypothetical protein
MNDTEVLDQVRDALGDIRMEVPLEAVVARGRARQRQRRQRVAACALAGLALVGTVFGVERSQPPAAGPHPATAQLAAFTVGTAPGGMTVVTLRKGAQYRLDPDALRQALADHGIRALVTVGTSCDTSPETGGLDQVVSSRREADGAVYLTIDPATLPTGSELSIGYYPNGTSFALIVAGAPLRCSAVPPGGQQGAVPRPVPGDGQ